MPTLNADIPQFSCYVRAEYLYNLESHENEFVRGTVFAVTAIEGRALGFHVLLENGACIWRLPIQALVHHYDSDAYDILLAQMKMRGPGDDEFYGPEKRLCRRLQLWDCFSYQLAVTKFEQLSGMRCRVHLKDKSTIGGEYMFTIDWYGNAISESAGDGGHKCHHFIKLDDGFFAAQPNNRVCFHDPAVIKAFPAGEPPQYKTNTHTWKVEQGDKWTTSDDDLMFYGVEELEADDGV